MKQPIILPKPQELIWREGHSAAKEDDVVFASDGALHKQAYRLQVEARRIQITSSGEEGRFYARQTLRQLAAQSPGGIPCCEISDRPQLPVRGFMMDISRGKVPTLETVYRIVDLLALLKMNHLEMYIEGFSFAYPSFPAVWAEGTPFTPEEFRKLDRYCIQRHIDLVPCQNTLGHMEPWLKQPACRHLAESDGEVEILGFTVGPATLNPTDPGSLKLLQAMTDDLLACFCSGSYNVCLDEPYELGKGKSAAKADETGVGGLYLEHIKNMHAMAANAGKRMLMWGDFVGQHPQVLDGMPKDITILEWGYDRTYPFEKNLSLLQEKGFGFYVCPGTSSWSSYTGITDNMLANITAAANAAAKYGGSGLLLTDWGDGGHVQYLPVSYAPLAFAGALAWNNTALSEPELTAWLDSMVFGERAGGMGTLALQLGRYQRFEPAAMPGRTFLAMAAPMGLHAEKDIYARIRQYAEMFLDTLPPETAAAVKRGLDDPRSLDYAGLEEFLDSMKKMLDERTLACEDGALIKREYANAILMLRGISHALRFASGRDGIEAKARRDMAGAAAALVDAALAEHKALWLARNKAGGMEISCGVMERMAQALREAANE